MEPKDFSRALLASMKSENVMQEMMSVAIRAISTEIAPIFEKIESLQRDINCLVTTEIADFKTKISDLTEVIKQKDERISFLEHRVASLESAMDDHEQYSRRNSLRLSGVAELPNELYSGDMVFYPFEFDERIERYITDFDADDQYFSDFLKGYGSPYYDESTFYDKFSSFSSSDNFFVLHHNIRSAPRNLTSLMSYLKCLSMDFSLIGLSETWFSEGTIDAVRLPGYKHVYNLRKTRGGGVSIFIRNNLRILEHPELSVCHDSFESIFVELPKGSLLNYKKALFIGVVYRPPRYNHDAFNNHLVNILQTI
uniref:Uncharacterized protein n=2 Tax=Capitella teleta TaxID=283909 RepID=X1ZPB3_CAPTE